MFSLTRFYVEGRDRRDTLCQNFMFKSKICEMCIIDLNIAKALENMYIHIFFISLTQPLSNKGLVTLYKYTLIRI